MRLTILGTGNALVTRCYNTCFTLDEGNGVFLVDGGGGNAVLRQLDLAGIPVPSIHDIFVTHRHVDHLLGILWVMRMILHHMQHGAFTGDARVYGHAEVIDLLRHMAVSLLAAGEIAFIDRRFLLTVVEDGETRAIGGRPVTFFDIGSTKARQFGFSMGLDGGGRLVCCGDEPCSAAGEPYAAGARWLLHEAFCLHTQADVYAPYEKHHSTVRDACLLAERLGVENLVLYHTEDDNLARRRELYTAEGRPLFRGNLFVPDDLDVIEVS